MKQESRPKTPLLDSIEREVNRRKEQVKDAEKYNHHLKSLRYLFIGKTIAGGIVTELKKINGGRAQTIDGGILFGLKVHIMRSGKPEQIDIC